MTHTMALVHTVGEVVPTFKALCAEIVPDVACFHVLDEGIIRTFSPEGEITPRTVRRLAEVVSRAEDDGADLILVTCSTISPTVDLVAPQVGVPVLKIDQPMADLAVTTGQRIGVLATAKSAMTPVKNLVRGRAKAAHRSVEMHTLFLEGAMQSLQSGDAASHDRRVIQGIKELARWAEVVVLAQGSMASALDDWPQAEWPCPILTNARLGLERASEMLKTAAG